eukprot:448141_1
MDKHYKEIIQYSYLEWLLNKHNHPQPPYKSFQTALSDNWREYAQKYFTIIEDEYDDFIIDEYKQERTIHQNYLRWYKNQRMNKRYKTEVQQFKNRMNKEFSKWFINKDNITDLKILKFENIGQWFIGIQNSMKSPHMRKKSDKNKGKHLVHKSSVKKKKKKKKKNHKRRYDEMN